LLRLEEHSGHGGGDQVSKTIDYGTDIWSFLIHELNTPTQAGPADDDASN
jgi:prolyl oligopeptidase PreP (S9A serine peptidase family)